MSDCRYKVLIVEDEPLERKALSLLLDRMDVEFEIKEVSSAPDFEVKAQEFKPDLVLLDIHIPGGDGLSSLRKLRECDFSGEVILVTAYDVFQYAQKAMGLGVSSFLVKPVTESRLKEVVYKVLDSIDLKRGRREEMSHLRQFIEKNRGPFVMRMIQDLIRSGTISEAMTDAMSSLKLPPAQPCHLFGVITIAEERGIGTESLVLWESFERSLGEEAITVPWNGGLSFFIIPSGNDMDEVDRWVSRFLEVIMKNNSPANVVYGGLIKKLRDIPPAVSDLEETLEESLLSGVGIAVMRERTCSMNFDEVSKRESHYDLEEVQNALEEAFLNNRIDLLAFARDKLDGFIRSSPLDDFNMVKFMIVGLLGQVCRVLLRLKCDPSSVSAWTRRQMLNMISIQTPMAMIKNMPGAFDEAWNIRSSASDPSVILIEQALHYIEGHYDEVTLEKTAEEVHVSPSYLSRTFRRVLDERFVDRVKNVRLDRAKKLLQEGTSVRDVAISVGYGNIAYFSTLFKQNMGISPSDYSKSQKF